MKQVMQDLSTGETYVIDAPVPNVTKGCVLIDTSISLISAGTERMLVDFGKASLLDKARQQPDKVKMVIDKIKTDGLLTTIDAVKSKLAQPIPLGYCNVGVISEVGHGVEYYKPGERVVSNGPHADVVNVPVNLSARIPDNVDDETASFTVLASIGLQGIRLAKPELGEYFVVTGAGLIGLLTIQMLIANGCHVLAIDFDKDKLDIAKSYGASTCNPADGEDPVSAAYAFSLGNGVDSVIITASTKSNDPVSQAARMCRKRGRIILVGVVGLELNRTEFYEKELSFQVSCSYGPGRYDIEYENKGHDYPYGYVRWTEQRNFEAVLGMMAKGKIDVKSLVSHRYSFDNVKEAYEKLANDKKTLGLLLQYTSDKKTRHNTTVRLSEAAYDTNKPVVSFIGAGNYASRILIPAFKEAGGQLRTIVTSGGVSSAVNGKKAGFAKASTDVDSILSDSDTNVIVVATRHNTHASYVIEALRAKKNVFVEKPLALTMDELDDVFKVYNEAKNEGSQSRLMVGYNRRFSPHIKKIKSLLSSVNEPKTFIMTMNAGEIPKNHWTQDKEIGGGRIIGEACHLIDLMKYLADADINSMHATSMGNSPGVEVTEDKAVITLGFTDGSIGAVHYFANGAQSFPKERIEVFVSGRVLQLDNFRKLHGFGWPGFKKMHLYQQDKGQKNCVVSFLDAVNEGKPSPIDPEDLYQVAKFSILAAEMIRGK
ncbi:MAG: bi-domain-containing oxidoreductase [Gammaproteobacteria bacterium]|nr:bi-domain-containing oxidoreductase [Gammaproteobacteria bacterium]